MPFGAAAAAVAGGVASAAASSLFSGKASGQVAAGQQQAQADLAPYVSAGTNALGAANNLLGLNGQDAANAAMANYQTSPGYQWQMDEGLRSINQGAAAQGAFRSGATVKAEEAYGQGLANQDFNQYYNRLYNIANMGQNSAAGAATSATNAATQQAGITANQGAQDATAVGSIFANPKVVSGITSGINSLFGGGGSGMSGTGPVSGAGGDPFFGNTL